jgi:uncharacterized protein YdeI (BOF family)
MPIGTSLLAGAVALAIADTHAQHPQRSSNAAAPAQQQSTTRDRSDARGAANPYARANNSWIVLGGTAEDVGPDSFELDYGDGQVTVEMDDHDRDADGYVLRNGDEVKVSGLVDDDLFESTSIEASSVYVEKLGTYFFAHSADEEDVPLIIASTNADSSIIGTVTGVGANEFVLDRGVRSITVEVENMAYDPLDDEGYQRIELGDVVSVVGTFDRDFFEGRELEARSIVTLFDPVG